MDFLEYTWEKVLRPRYLYGLLRLYLDHPEWLDDPFRKEVFDSLKVDYKKAAPYAELNALKEWTIPPYDKSREEDLEDLLDYVKKKQLFEKILLGKLPF